MTPDARRASPGSGWDRQALRQVLRTWSPDLPDDLADDASLIRSGLLDSTALFQLVLWLEDQIGAPVSPAEHDLAAEWDTIADLVAFVERHRAG